VSEVQTQRRVVVAPEDAQVSITLRFDPRLIEQYFHAMRSFQVYVSPAETYETLTKQRLDEWTRHLLEAAWSAVVMGLVPPMEIYPVIHEDAYESAFYNEITMHLENAMNMFSERMNACIKLYKSLPELVKLGEKEKYYHQLENCVELTLHAPYATPILARFILEFVHRKAQFSLPLQAMPNSAKAKAGILTD
jgi:hypothetical protein